MFLDRFNDMMEEISQLSHSELYIEKHKGSLENSEVKKDGWAQVLPHIKIHSKATEGRTVEK